MSYLLGCLYKFYEDSDICLAELRCSHSSLANRFCFIVAIACAKSLSYPFFGMLAIELNLGWVAVSTNILFWLRFYSPAEFIIKRRPLS